MFSPSEVVGSRVVRIREPNPKLLVGEGKAQEIVQLAENAEADVIVFDDFLTPSGLDAVQLAVLPSLPPPAVPLSPNG